MLALDPFALAVLKVHVETLDQERRELGPDAGPAAPQAPL
jgi:hypothetical protein